MKKHQMGVLVEKNSFVDRGEGLIEFPNKLVITDNTQQRNGTRYDIDSMDLSEYKGQVTADHVDMLEYVIGKVNGLAKVGTQVVVDSIQFAIKENALALTAYNLLKGGFLTDFSIETYGPYPDPEEEVYYNAKLIGLSAVVVGNNRNATVNKIVRNSIEQAKEKGLEVTDLEKQFLSEAEFKIKQSHQINNKEVEEMKFVTIRNSRDFAVKVTYKNAAGEPVDTTLEPGKTVDVSEDQKDVVERQVNEAEAPTVVTNPGANDEEAAAKKAADEKAAEEAAAKAQEEQKNAISEAVKAALAPVQEQMAKIEKQAFDKGATEPGFHANGAGAPKGNGETDMKAELKSMSWQERHGVQINAAWDAMKGHSTAAREKLHAINEFHYESLKEQGIVTNAMAISDFGNFVISPELITEIAGCRNDYTALINATEWRETMSTQFAWLKRSGDINMQNVEFCDDGANGNLKPLSEYDATFNTANLEEMAAVTPICNAATRFLAADILGDVASGYRNDYDRKRAQLVIARLEQAVESNGKSVIFDTNPSVEALESLLAAWKQIANCTPNGTFVMNTSSAATILGYALRAGINGPLGQLFTTGQVTTLFGKPYIVVSDDLMPSLDTAGTVTIQVEGSNVTVNHAVFYADLRNFTGRISGGLQYDLSTEAAYEQGGVTKSAYQRNELVLRGSFFRGGAVKDTAQVSGILAPGVS